MSVSNQEFHIAKMKNLSLEAVDSDVTGITKITAEIDGVWWRPPTLNQSKPSRLRLLFSRGQTPKIPQNKKYAQKYRIYTNVSGLKYSLPDVWVLEPDNSQIRHYNIFSPKFCPDLRRNLAYFCWGSFPRSWTAVSVEQRTLTNFLDCINDHLNHPNPKSPARGSA